MLSVVRNASAVRPTLHHTMIGSAARVVMSPLLARPTRMKVTAVALCMSPPKASPTRLACNGECVVRCTSVRKLAPVSWRSDIPISWMPRKKRPRPRTRVLNGAATDVDTVGRRASCQGDPGGGIFSKTAAARRSRRGDIKPHGGSTMAQQTKTPKPTMVSTMRYDDAGGMIEWLGKAFGFERRFVVPGDNGTIAHAQLVFGSGMIMLGTARDDEWGRIVKTVRAAGAPSSSVYVVVADCDAHHARAKAAGAEILYGPRDTDYGSREYAARDPEGHIWNFGTYDPWA